MSSFRSFHLVAGLLGLALLSGCGGSSDKAGTGTMNVHLVDGPIAGYQEINVHIQRVEISGDGGWITLATPDKTINLLGLVGGVEETLAAGATLPAGHYGQMRLILGAGNSVRLADGTLQDLTVPSGLQTGIKLIVNFDVAAGTTKDVFLDFQAAHAIQVVAAGATGKYLLRPTVWAFDKLITGSISGALTDKATAAPLSGVLVYAETLDLAGKPTIARSTVTSATGAYRLDLLPLGATYHVVSLPQTATPTVAAYAPQASDGFALTALNPTFTFQGAFTLAPATNGLTGGVTPVATADQSDSVDLLASLTTPSLVAHTFVVATTSAAVGAATETYAFSNLPAGAYSVRGRRTTAAMDGTFSSVLSAPKAVLIPATGPAATLNLTF